MTAQPPRNARSRCRRERDAAAYLLNSLPAGEAKSFEAHLAHCPDCTAAVEALRPTAELLRAAPAEQATTDLTAGILARLPADAWKPRVAPSSFTWAPALRVAALLLVALGLVVLSRRATSPAPREARTPVATPVRSASDQALAWLQRAQREDGSWSSGSTGIRKQYEIGITAMALMALMECDPSALQGERSASIRRGLDYLVRRQGEDGLIGNRFSGALYNQGLATLALLKAREMEAQPAWDSAIERSLAYIRRAQEESGGWGYLGAPPGKPNTSASFWPLQALVLAERLGYSGLDTPIRRALDWMQDKVNSEGEMGYVRPGDFPYGPETLTAAGAVCFLMRSDSSGRGTASAMLPRVQRAASADKAPDFYRTYFLAAALDLAGDAQSAELLESLQSRLAALQTQDGPDAGSWDAADRWGSVGGRVYATAMAAMALACN